MVDTISSFWQAPSSMRSCIMAISLLTVSVGSLLVIVVKSLHITDDMVSKVCIKLCTVYLKFHSLKLQLHEKCPNTELFLVRSSQIWTEYGGQCTIISMISLNQFFKAKIFYCDCLWSSLHENNIFSQSNLICTRNNRQIVGSNNFFCQIFCSGA